MNFQTFLGTALFVGLLLAGAGFMAGPTTVGLFTDSEAMQGSIQAAGSFATTPPNACAYDDVNGNGIWNQGEPSYQERELSRFEDGSVTLVITEDCGSIENTGNIEIAAGSITSEADFVANGFLSRISLTATDGTIDLHDQQLFSNYRVSVSASEHVNMKNIAIVSVGNVNIEGSTLSVEQGAMGSNYGEIQLTTTTGDIHATGASLTARGNIFQDGDIQLESNGDIELENAMLDGNDEITADLRRPDNTLFVDEASVSDSDDTLVYTPPNITVDGTLSSGTLRQGSTTLAMTNTLETSARKSNVTREEIFPEETTDWEALGERLNVSVSPPR
ncbi:hypothetical protein [Halorhabdus rudnickae]|uniref:hypothetical protein n=1 Tax=Halorhabdus rudnickae TaxID=1775544 RepID=UPI001082E61F|nr:hypothetical protein [Halorhabdus rudnickae]